LQKVAPVDDVSPGGISGAQSGISIPGDGDDQAHDVQLALAHRLSPLAAPLNADAQRNGVSFPIPEQKRRLALMLASHGATFSAQDVIASAIRRLDDLAELSERRAIETGKPELPNDVKLYRGDAADAQNRLTS